MAKKRIGLVSIILGVVLILGAAGIVGNNFREAQVAAEYSQETMREIVKVMPETLTMVRVEETPALLPTEIAAAEEELKVPLTVVNIDGNDYVGVITIPSLELELPVMSEWSYPNLKLSLCRYYGEYPREALVICAHNYITHFGRLRELNPGDTVMFTDMEGNVYVYVVDALEEVTPYDIEDVTSGEWPLTLFTCTPGGRTRVVVRCDFAEAEN